jgi:hypothetical protein
MSYHRRQQRQSHIKNHSQRQQLWHKGLSQPGTLQLSQRHCHMLTWSWAQYDHFAGHNTAHPND